jgi:hypothetical protein
MNQQVMELWKKGFIEESNSYVSSNLLLVKKPRSNALRLCTNLVRCNKECQQVDEKLPTLEQGLSKLGNKKVFSVIDLRQGFWQLPVVKEARKCLAFKTPSGLFQWTVMPFGLKTAPALFTKAIRKLLSAQFGDEAFKKLMGNATLDADDYAFAYMDDIIIFSDDEESHVQHVADVLRRIREFGLKVSAEKCHLFKQEVRYLGHIISTKGTRMDPDKVSVLRNIPLPKTVTALHSFIATVGFYKNFFGMRFVELAKPLRKMVQEGNMNWTKSAVKKFEMMKDMITNEKFLTPPDWNKRFFLKNRRFIIRTGRLLLPVR